jgi:hypothetical protein
MLADPLRCREVEWVGEEESSGRGERIERCRRRKVTEEMKK